MHTAYDISELVICLAIEFTNACIVEKQCICMDSRCFADSLCCGLRTYKVDFSMFSFHLQANSEHPLAKAVVEYAKRLRQKFGPQTEQMTDIKEFEVHPGAGVSGKVGDKLVLVGNKRLMQDSSVPVSPEVENHISETENLARTCVLVAINGKVAGAFAVTDPVKPEAGRVISFLHSMDISTVMMTGDNWATATAIAKEVGIKEVYAETDPLGKAERIKNLQVCSFSYSRVWIHQHIAF